MVKVSPFADESDLVKNVKSAIVIADKLGVSVNIRAHIDPGVIQNHKNPEYEINGNIADRKEISSYTSIKSNLKSAKKQKVRSIVYGITDFKGWKASAITKHLKGKILNFKDKEWLREIFFINGDNAISFTRQELFTNFDDVLQKLESLNK